jgi:hypothetical protein
MANELSELFAGVERALTKVSELIGDAIPIMQAIAEKDPFVAAGKATNAFEGIFSKNPAHAEDLAKVKSVIGKAQSAASMAETLATIRSKLEKPPITAAPIPEPVAAEAPKPEPFAGDMITVEFRDKGLYVNNDLVFEVKPHTLKYANLIMLDKLVMNEVCPLVSLRVEGDAVTKNITADSVYVAGDLYSDNIVGSVRVDGDLSAKNVVGNITK